ncbi:hypothetical protein [Desertibacillus haloalkaliphilus]|uniref:hypothetical protein n=1 Tax=Desertibacillus haloalkaliphilus TaxID=1328930 RepID=UPI001C26C3E0|nr:hypothetical protein [Desertibacillus haloalkaliphilus]MBU8907893.1 hypothetical protein [Desertibacillus haloalkaliphilus]
MEANQFGIHEITDLRELINFKAACLSEAKSRLNQVENQQLKSLVEQSVKQGTATVTEMQSILKSTVTKMDQ